MPLSVARVLPGRAGKILFVCALSSVSAAYLVSQHRHAHTDETDVSLLGKEAPEAALRARPAASETAAASNAAADAASNAASNAAAARPASSAPAKPAPSFTVKQASIERTFGDAVQSIGIDARTAALLSRAFRGQLDFTRDLRAGDRVSAVFDASAAHEPLAVRISRGTLTHDLFLHRNLQGQPFYYAKDGASTRPSFDRYPLDFSRVSSAFSLHRFDPVVHRWQSHEGVDLAAPSGTPVHATASGVVRFIGRQTGYGNVIEIQNPPPYSTTFAHLSRFAKGLHRGSRVKRDQVIGYVGQTGWATGPHLHYEVHVRHVPRDPLTVQLPQGSPLHANELAQFEARVAKLSALL